MKMSETEGGTTTATMVSDQRIAQALECLLRESNPNNTTTSITLDGVVQLLGSNLGFDLTHKTDFIRSQIQLLLRPQPPPPPRPPLYHLPHPPKDHFPFHRNPNLYHPPPSSPLPSNFARDNHHLHPDNFIFPQQPQPPPPPPPPPPPVPKAEPFVPGVAATSSATPSVVSAAPEAPKESSQAGKKRRGGPGGLNKLCGVSPELQAIVGQPALPRTEIVKQLWAYIRKNNLQDPSNKRKIICNKELRLVFETDFTDMFKMNRLLAKHIISLEPTKQTAQNSKKLKVDTYSVSRNAESVPEVILSEALANFFGTGDKEMVQAKVVERVWDYIHANNLVDSLNSMVIACDAKLQELFGCQSISASGMSDMLERHHLFRKS